MNCREFIIEFEDRENLSEPAKLHLTVCADCQKVSARQTRIWLMIDGLKPIAAPDDFDFRVRAKIANVKPSDYKSPRFLPVLRYVLPLSVAAVLFGLLVFNSGYFSGSRIATTVAGNASESPSIQNPAPVDAPPTERFTAADSNAEKPSAEPLFAAVKPTVEIASETIRRTKDNRNAKLQNPAWSSNRQTKSSSKPAARSADISSRDIASTGTFVRTPKGINLNNDTNAAPKFEGSKPADDASVLKFFGIETVSENGRRTVKSVDKDSAAEHSGVKIGDVIERVKDNTVLISRGTEKMEIVLQNNADQKP